MSDTHDSLIQKFCEVTGLDPQSARHYLEASNWNLETATAQYFDPEGQEQGQDDIPAPSSSTSQSATPSSSSSRPATKPKAKSKIATFGDLGRDNDDDDDDDERRKQDLFAGGEKSGLAIQNPGDNNSGNRLINDILRRAAEGGQHGHSHDEDDEDGPAARAPRFAGSGRTLGGEGAESVTIPDPNPPPRTQDVVQRTLTFWRDGFSVEDGPLYRYDDPNNRQILQAIEAGRAPLSLMNVEVGQTADVRVFKRLEEDYVQPKKKFVPFSGQGQRLGDATTVSVPAPAAPQPAAAQSSSSQAQPAPAPAVDIDSSAPTTNIQIRLGDGTRLVSRFNHTHTVGDIYGFVNAASVSSRSRDYVLQTTFPNRELRDHAQSIKDAGLVNAVVMQKWVS